MPNNPNKSGFPWGVAIFVAVVLPVLYVLSVGPAAWLLEKQYIDSDVVYDVYRPVYAVAYRSETFGNMLDSYVMHCGGASAKFALTQAKT